MHPATGGRIQREKADRSDFTRGPRRPPKQTGRRKSVSATSGNRRKNGGQWCLFCTALPPLASGLGWRVALAVWSVLPISGAVLAVATLSPRRARRVLQSKTRIQSIHLSKILIRTQTTAHIQPRHLNKILNRTQIKTRIQSDTSARHTLTTHDEHMISIIIN